MAILAIDTCLEQCAAAILSDDGTVFSALEPLSKGHAERLPLMVRDLFEETGMTMENIEKIAVTRGPGSFTGVRVGLAFSRGLAIGRRVDVHGMTSLEALAYSCLDQPLPPAILALIDARRGQVYGQLYLTSAKAGSSEDEFPKNVLIPAAPAFVLSPEDARKQLETHGDRPNVLLAGSGVCLVYPDRHPERAFPDPGIMAKIVAETDFYLGEDRPAYLRAPDAVPRSA